MRIAVALLASVILTSGSTGASEVRVVRLEVEPAITLPGLPVSITIDAVGMKAGTSATWAGLHVRPEGGDPFFAGSSTAPFEVKIAPEDWFSISPTTRRLEYPIDSFLESPPWFADARLCRPGIYGLQIVIADDPGLTHVLAQSPEVKLVIDTPGGGDARVWREMRRVAEDWSTPYWRGRNGRQVAKLISEDFPNSTYAKYVVLLVPHSTYEEKERYWDECLKDGNATPIADWIRFEKAKLREQRARNEMGKGNTERDVNRAIALAGDARALYFELLESTRSDEVRRQVTRQMSDLRGEDYYLEYDRRLRAHRPSTPEGDAP